MKFILLISVLLTACGTDEEEAVKVVTCTEPTPTETVWTSGKYAGSKTPVGVPATDQEACVTE